MKKLVFLVAISVISALGITNQELLNLSEKAKIRLNLDKSLSNYLIEKQAVSPATETNESFEKLPIEKFIHECHKNDIAVFREIYSKEFIAKPRDDIFKKSWNESCNKLKKLIKVSKETINSKPLKLKSGVLHLESASNLALEECWYIAKFKSSPSATQFEIGEYVGQNSWLVKPKRDCKSKKITSAVKFRSENKINPFLYSYDSYQIGDSPDLRTINIHVINSKKISETKLQIQNLDGEIVSEITSIGCITAMVPVEKILELSENENIKWIEKTGPPLSICNDGAREAVGANTAQFPLYEYSGTNVDVLVYDAGLTDAHADYSSRMSNIETGSTHYHATHVAGTILGDGSQSSGTYRGMAPKARLLSGEYDGNASTLFYNNPADIEGDYNTAINTYGADLANNSIGMNIQGNGYPESYYGDYETCSILIDNIATGILGRAFLSIWAAGNERGYVSGYKNIGPPQCAKNSLIVGATYSDNNQITDFSSFGPLDDGRLKPDLCAPGDETGAGIYSTYGTTDYQDLAGTSMASPVATGCATLLTECWKDYHSGANPAPAVVKAILINTTLDLDAPGPGFDTGYGLIQIIPAIEAVKNNNIIESEISDGITAKYSLYVPNTADSVRVTLVWSDPPASPLADPVLVNDLDIKLIDPAGGIHYPWTLDAANPATPAINNVADHLNNVEQVFAQNVTGGVWEVEILGYNVPIGNAQPFALCANANLRDLSSVGVVFLNQSSYKVPSDVIIEVKDIDLTNETSITVSTFSETDPAGETVALIPFMPGILTGKISLTTSSPSTGFLSVSHGDTISVVYNDASSDLGEINVDRIATAAIDLIPPAIFNVTVVNTDASTATIKWETDKLTKGSLILTSPTTKYPEIYFKTLHQLTFTNLTQGTKYHFYIVETDSIGLTTTNNNSGNYFSFRTKIFKSGFESNAESNLDEWANTSNWHRSQLRVLSDSWSWYCGDETSQEYPNEHTAYLETPNITINEQNASLRFKEYVNTEADWDYCYLKISSAGSSWVDLRPKVDGNIPTRNVSISLNDYVPGTFKIRFLFESDTYVTEEGWYLDDIKIGELTYNNLIIDSIKANDPMPEGDGDGKSEPNETINLQVILLNDMNQSLSNINSTLLTDSPYVSLIQSSSSYGNMLADSKSTNSTLFSFSIATNAPNHATLPFTLVCSDSSGQVWSNDFNIFVDINAVPEGSFLFIVFAVMLWSYRKIHQ